MSEINFINKYVVSYTRSDGEHQSFATKGASIADLFPILEIGMKDVEFTSLIITQLGKVPATLPNPANNKKSKYF